MQLNANSHSLLLVQADCFVRGLTLTSNTVVENLCMRQNIGPAAAGPAGPIRPWGGARFQTVSHALSTKGLNPSALQLLLGFFSYTLCHRTTKFDVVAQVGEGRVSRGQTRLPSQESGAGA